MFFLRVVLMLYWENFIITLKLKDRALLNQTLLLLEVEK